MKKALLQLNAAVFLWGFTGVLGRAITLDSVLLVWYRLLITIISLGAFFIYHIHFKVPATTFFKRYDGKSRLDAIE